MVKKRWPLLKWLFWIYSNSFGMFSLNVGYFEWWATDWPLTSLFHFEKSASSISRSMDCFQTTCIHLCKLIQENSLTMYGHVTICIPIEQKLCTYRISSHLPSSSQVQETFFRTGLKVWKAQLTNWWLDILPACLLWWRIYLTSICLRLFWFSILLHVFSTETNFQLQWQLEQAICERFAFGSRLQHCVLTIDPTGLIGLADLLSSGADGTLRLCSLPERPGCLCCITRKRWSTRLKRQEQMVVHHGEKNDRMIEWYIMRILWFLMICIYIYIYTCYKHIYFKCYAMRTDMEHDAHLILEREMWGSDCCQL